MFTWDNDIKKEYIERICDIKLLNTPAVSLFTLFDVTANIPDIFEKYYVRSPRLISTPTGFYCEVNGYGIYDIHHRLIGEIRDKVFSEVIIVSFYLRARDQIEALLEFIDSTIKEMRFIGFTIIDVRNFSEDSKGIINVKDINLPKRKSARDKWKECYRVICDLKEELLNSESWDSYTPQLSDYKERIKKDLGLGYSEKTISKIIKAGKMGLLE